MEDKIITGADIATLQQQINDLAAQYYQIQDAVWTGTQYCFILRYHDPIADGMANLRYDFQFYADGSAPGNTNGWTLFTIGGNGGVLVITRYYV